MFKRFFKTEQFKRIIRTDKAPLPIGPYNQATVFGNMVYVSGQIALDPLTGAMVQESLELETHRVMMNVREVLLEAGSNENKILKATVFIRDMSQFGRINAVYAKFFDEATAPARETVEVSALPKGANVEISVIAYV
jgi:2-iminobutanoate/2-iminopropanoate deaminase